VPYRYTFHAYQGCRFEYRFPLSMLEIIGGANIASCQHSVLETRQPTRALLMWRRLQSRTINT
jgi:hypothetical protein